MSTEEGNAYLKEAYINLIVEFEKLKERVDKLEGIKPISSIDNSDFVSKLKAIKGIGDKTIKDILDVYQDEDSLLTDIANGDKLPFRDDIEKKLKEVFK